MHEARKVDCEFLQSNNFALAALIHPSLLSAGPELYNHMASHVVILQKI